MKVDLTIFYAVVAVFLGLIFVQAFFDTHEVVERQIREQQFLRGE